ncbi:threonine synthase [Bifidobacterium parmae]|uniref:Threonine synthase n=1 Tax=Bifidobacterium parmae TaxID=361854 RepID=A0A2N5J5K3_9BIFI|nr:threonine synthase [Bifidobacterium parmae]
MGGSPVDWWMVYCPRFAYEGFAVATTFHSTRSTTDSLTAKQAIRKGIADDGGLFVSDQLGSVKVEIGNLAGRSYQEIARRVLGALLPDFTAEELGACIDAAYGDQWSDDRVTPLKPLGDDFVLELFNGPTSAFKDVALQILPRFMARTTPAGGDADEKIMILTATSGDTGKAALAGFADAPGTAITVFYPEGKVSQVQELQMTTQTGSNVNVAAVEGNFDDAQSAVKRIFGDKELAAKLAGDAHVVLSSANSINVGRLVPQVVYYFSAYAQLLERQVINVGDEVEFVVPTGNFGDILAGYYAKLLGLPVKHLVVASDKNNVLFDFLTTGTYNRQRPFFQTISPSMDILISSNLERMLYYLSEGDTRLIAMLMNDLKNWGTYEIPEPLLAKIRQLFGCGWADEDQVREMIADCWEKNHYVIDPHTACAYFVAQQMPHDPLTPRVILATASPYKFPRVVNESLGFDATGTDFECMDVLARETGTTAPAALRGLETADVRFDTVVPIDGMEAFVEQAAKAL